MNLPRHHRSLLAWTLYACVLFNAFACSLGHAQSAGLQLSGLDSLFCSVDGSAATDSATAINDSAGTRIVGSGRSLATMGARMSRSTASIMVAVAMGAGA